MQLQSGRAAVTLQLYFAGDGGLGGDGGPGGVGPGHGGFAHAHCEGIGCLTGVEARKHDTTVFFWLTIFAPQLARTHRFRNPFELKPWHPFDTNEALQAVAS